MATVGIFSRDSPDNYQWLLLFLHTFLLKDNVRTVTITNSTALSIIGISFAILYHTKNRGRINVTDVTDSLYDRELEELSRALGVKNVIVVIDDLEDNSDLVKRRILENQPSICRRARDLLLFTAMEKQDGGQDPTNTANIIKIREIITGHSIISWLSSDPSYRTSQISSSHMRWIPIIPVLSLYIWAVYYYNYKVLLW